jgi:hypothetical protein
VLYGPDDPAIVHRLGILIKIRYTLAKWVHLNFSRTKTLTTEVPLQMELLWVVSISSLGQVMNYFNRFIDATWYGGSIGDQSLSLLSLMLARSVRVLQWYWLPPLTCDHVSRGHTWVITSLRDFWAHGHGSVHGNNILYECYRCIISGWVIIWQWTSRANTPFRFSGTNLVPISPNCQVFGEKVAKEIYGCDGYTVSVLQGVTSHQFNSSSCRLESGLIYPAALVICVGVYLSPFTSLSSVLICIAASYHIVVRLEQHTIHYAICSSLSNTGNCADAHHSTCRIGSEHRWCGWEHFRRGHRPERSSHDNGISYSSAERGLRR